MCVCVDVLHVYMRVYALVVFALRLLLPGSVIIVSINSIIIVMNNISITRLIISTIDCIFTIIVTFVVSSSTSTSTSTSTSASASTSTSTSTSTRY